MIITTTTEIPGKEVKEILGVVRGNTVRARNIGRDIVAVIKNMIGGEIEEYTKLLAEARDQALDRMAQQAESMGANAVINVRFATSFIMTSAAEMLAYGTAVKIENKH